MGREPKVQKPNPADANKGLIVRAQLDSRLRITKGFDVVRRELAEAMGGDLSPQAAVLLERAVFLIWTSSDMERAMMDKLFDPKTAEKRAGRPASDPMLKDYTMVLSSLHRILNTLGLKRVRKEKDLSTVMAELSQEDNQ